MSNCKGQDVLPFLEDANIGIETGAEHVKSLDEIHGMLYDTDIRLNLSKFHFRVRQVEVLGHFVEPEGVRPAEGHMQAIHWLQERASCEELMRFAVLANYFSRFIDHFADMTRPL